MKRQSCRGRLVDAVSQRQASRGRRRAADGGRRTAAADGGRRRAAGGGRRTSNGDGGQRTADGGRRTNSGRARVRTGKRRTAESRTPHRGHIATPKRGATKMTHQLWVDRFCVHFLGRQAVPKSGSHVGTNTTRRCCFSGFWFPLNLNSVMTLRSAMAEELQDGKSAAEISKALRLEKKDFPSRVSGSHKMTTWTVTRHVWSSVP